MSQTRPVAGARGLRRRSQRSRAGHGEAAQRVERLSGEAREVPGAPTPQGERASRGRHAVLDVAAQGGLRLGASLRHAALPIPVPCEVTMAQKKSVRE